MEVEYDKFPPLHFNPDGLSVNFYQYVSGWTQRTDDLAAVIRYHLDREGIANDYMSIEGMEELDYRLQRVLSTLHGLICYPAPETEYPAVTKGLITQIYNFTKGLNEIKDVIDFSNEVCEVAHVIEKLDLTLACLSASHNYAKYFFGDVFKLEDVSIHRVLEVFATCITRVGLANVEILTASFSLGFSNLDVRTTMIEVIKTKDIVYDVAYNILGSSGKIYNVLQRMMMPIIQYILYLFDGTPNIAIVDRVIDQGMKFSLIRDEATKQCASNCMDAYRKLDELRQCDAGAGPTEEVALENYVTTEGLYMYTVRLNHLIDNIVQHRPSQSLIAISEVENIKTIGMALGCEPDSIRSEAGIIDFIREFVAEILHRDRSVTDAFNLRATVTDELARKNSEIHQLNNLLGLANNKYEDLNMGNQQLLAIVARCLNKLNACIVNNDNRPAIRQLNEGDIEATVNQVCTDMDALSKSNKKLTDDIERLTDRTDESHTATRKKAAQHKQLKDSNKTLAKEKRTLTAQLRMMEDNCATELAALKADNHRLNTDIANAEIGRLMTEIGIKEKSIASHQSRLDDLRGRSTIIEGQLRESNVQNASLIENNNVANAKLAKINELYEELKVVYDRDTRDLTDESRVLQEKFDKTNKDLTELQTRLELAFKKTEESEKKTRDFAQQISHTLTTNKSLNENNAALREKIKTKSDQYTTIYAELAEKNIKLKTVESQVLTLKGEQCDRIRDYNEQTVQLNNIEKRYGELQTSTNDAIRQLRGELGSAKSALTDQQGIHNNIVSQLNSQLEELRSSNKSLSDEITELNSTHDKRINAVSNELKKIQAELTQYERQCGDTNEEVVRLKSELRAANEYKQRYAASDSGFKVLKKENDDLSVRIETAKEREKMHATELNKFAKLSERLKSELETANNDLVKVRTELNTAQVESTRLNKELEGAKRSNANSARELQKRKDKVSELENRSGKFIEQAETLNNNLTSTREALNTERGKNKTLTEALDKLKADIEQLDNHYNESECKLGIANEKLALSHADILNRDAQIMQKEGELADAISQFTHKDTEYQETVKTLGTTEKALTESEKTVSELKDALQATKQELSTTTNIMNEMDVNLKSLQKTIDEKTELASMTNGTLTDHEKRIAMLRTELDGATKTSDRLKIEKQQLQESNGKLSTQIKNCEKNIERLQEEKTKCEETIGRLTTDIKVRTDTLEKHKNEYLAKFDALQKELAAIQRQYTTSQESVTTLNQNIAQRNEQINKLDQDNGALKTQLDNLRNQLYTSQETCDGTVEQLNGEIAQRNASIIGLNQRIEDLGIEVSDLKNEISTLLAELQKLNTENENLQKESLSYASECKQLKEKLTNFEQLQPQCDELERKISKMLDEAVQSEQLKNKYVETIQELKDDIEQRDASIRHLQTCTNEMRAAGDSVNTDIEQCKVKLSTYEQQINILNGRNAELESQVTALNKELNTRIQAAKEAAATTAMQIGELLDDTKNLGTVKDSLERQLRDRESECKRLGDKLTEFEALRDELKEKMADMEESAAARERYIEQLDIKRTEDSDKFSNQTEYLSSRIGSVTAIFIRSYEYCCRIHSLICELNRDILGAHFDNINNFEPMKLDQFAYDNINQIDTEVMNASDQMLKTVTRIANALKTKDGDIKRALEQVSDQCGFHRTSTLTAPEVISWASRIFSAIRPRESNGANNLYASVEEYCKLVREDIVVYTDNIDKLLKIFTSFKTRLTTLIDSITSRGS